MSAIIEQYERIQKIANLSIPVSEESPLYRVFKERKELCIKYINMKQDTEVFLGLINRYDEIIKQYLNL
jgi:hypothetical protein